MYSQPNKDKPRIDKWCLAGSDGKNRPTEPAPFYVSKVRQGGATPLRALDTLWHCASILNRSTLMWRGVWDGYPDEVPTFILTDHIRHAFSVL